MKNRFFYAVVLISITFSLTSCLKTRAQLREDSDIPVSPAQEVHFQSQYVLDEIKSEFTRLEGRVEDLEREQKSSASKNNWAEDFKKLEARVVQVEQQLSTLQEALKKAQEESTLMAPMEILKKAQSQFQDGDYETAADTFGLYLKSPKAVKIEEATYFRGECYYRLKQYKKAIVEYSKFPEKFTHSKRMPEVLYKIAFSFEAMQMHEDAKGFYQEVVEKFPKSDEAKKARKKLK